MNAYKYDTHPERLDIVIRISRLRYAYTFPSVGSSSFCPITYFPMFGRIMQKYLVSYLF